jgi:glycosyltransferase involved in cell wall biosynthesis
MNTISRDCAATPQAVRNSSAEIRPAISVVVPVYRSEGTPRALHERVVAVLEREVPAFEIIFVEDCGGAGSWQAIEALATADARVRGLRLSRNYAKHNALLCVIRAARHEVVVTIEDDLQNPPEEIPKPLAALILSKVDRMAERKGCAAQTDKNHRSDS